MLLLKYYIDHQIQSNQCSLDTHNKFIRRIVQSHVFNQSTVFIILTNWRIDHSIYGEVSVLLRNLFITYLVYLEAIQMSLLYIKEELAQNVPT